MTAMDDYQDIKEMLKPQRAIGASDELRQRILLATAGKRGTGPMAKWLWSGAAAACVTVVLGVTMLLNGKTSTAQSFDNGDCIVYVAGQQLSGEDAQTIAEADVARMEQFMLAVERQRAQEEAKVNQFMQHKTSSR